MPEPGAVATFESAVLDPTVVDRDTRAAALQDMHTELLRLRRDVPALADPSATQQVDAVGGAIAIRRTVDDQTVTVVINESAEPAAPDVVGRVEFRSDDVRWGGNAHTSDAVQAGWTVVLMTS